MSTFADYVDGESAVVHRVEVDLRYDRLRIVLPDAERVDWWLDDLREVPGQADRESLMLAQGGDTLARLMVSDPDTMARIRASAPGLHRRPPLRNPGRVFGWAGGAVLSVALIIFVLVPLMANQLAGLIPVEGERALGDATYEQIRAMLGEGIDPLDECTNAPGLAALGRMRTRLNAEKDLPYPVTVTVLDDDLVNAFAMPGGRVVLFRGLIEKAESPEEVAAVLAHELGHVAHRDPTRDALRLAGSIGVLGLLFGDFAGGTVALFLANELINAQYSQAAEAGADDYAHALMTQAGLPPGALGAFFERLNEEQDDEEGIFAHFASHPQMAVRIEAAMAAQEAVGTAGAPALSAAEWQDLRGICGGVTRPQSAPGATSSPAHRPGRLGRG